MDNDIPARGVGRDPALRPAVPPQGGTFGLLMLAGAELTELLERLVRRHASMTLAQFRTVGLMAARHPDRLEPWQIGETLGLPSNHISMILDQLEAREYVKRHPHPRDGRRRLIEITEDGRACAGQLTELTQSLEQRVIGAAVAPAQAVLLDDLLARILAEVEGLAEAMRRRPGP